jgi:hypothetical protein
MEKAKTIINSFAPPYEFLSSYYMKSTLYDVHGIAYKCLQQIFYSYLTDDLVIKNKIALLNNAQEIRLFGESLLKPKHTDGWRIVTMYNLSCRKFVETPGLADKIKATNPLPMTNILLYDDTFWGVYNEIGRDELAKINMRVREKLL